MLIKVEHNGHQVEVEVDDNADFVPYLKTLANEKVQEITLSEEEKKQFIALMEKVLEVEEARKQANEDNDEDEYEVGDSFEDNHQQSVLSEFLELYSNY